MVKLRKKGKNVDLDEFKEISDRMIGRGENMCSCAAIVADVIISCKQEDASLLAVMEKVAKGSAEQPEG